MIRLRRVVPHRLLPMAVLLLSCDSPTAPSGPPTEVMDEFRANAVLFTATAGRVGHDEVEVTLHAMNETDFRTQVSILGGNCMLRPRVYRERGGRLVWSAFDLHPACQEPLHSFDLEGGEEASLTQTFDIDARPGTYFATLTIEVQGSLVELAAGPVTLP